MAVDVPITRQIAPGATTLTDILAVTAAKKWAGRVTVCNRGAATSFRVSLAPLGAADATSQYLRYDTAIGANASLVIEGVQLAATDKMRGYGTSANVTFTFNGVENDA